MTANSMSSIPPIGPTSGMTPPPGGGRFKPIDPLRLLRAHLWLLVALVVLGVVVGSATWYALRQYSPRYTSHAQLRVASVNPEAWGGIGNQMSGFRMKAVSAMIQNEIAQLKSEELLQRALGHSEVRNTAWFGKFRGKGEQQNPDLQAALQSLKHNVISASKGQGSLMVISANTAKPADAEPILNAVLEVYTNHVRTERENQSLQLRKVYESERRRAEDEIDRLQGEIDRILSQTDMAALDSRASQAKTDYQRLVNRRIELELALDQAQEQYQSLKQQPSSATQPASSQAMQSVQNTPAVSRLEQRLSGLRQEKARLESRLGPEHYRIKDLQQQIDTVKAQRNQEVERLLREQRQAQLEQAAQQVASLKGQLTNLEDKLTNASKRLNDFQTQLNEYQQLKDQLAAARKDREKANTALTNLRLETTRPDAVRVQTVTGPSTPALTFPRFGVIVPGIALLVIGLGTGGLFLKEVLDQRLKSPADVKLIQDTELLGMLPEAQEDPSGPRRIEGAVDEHPTGLIAEAFRQVRTVVIGKMDRRGYKTLLLAGGQPHSGTSSIVQNLACSLAYHGRHVLVIDANMRRPAQHKLFNVPQSPGLVEVLQHEANIEDAVTRLDSPSVSVLPAGDLHEAPPELLASHASRSLIAELEPQYDMILIDAPPALLATDTQLLARQVDALALVVRAERDKRGMVDRMLRQLDGQRADVLGLILNGARSSAGGYFRKSYREFYRYSNGAASRNGNAPKRGPARLPETTESEPEQQQAQQ